MGVKVRGGREWGKVENWRQEVSLPPACREINLLACGLAPSELSLRPQYFREKEDNEFHLELFAACSTDLEVKGEL